MAYFSITVTALISFLVMAKVLSSFICEPDWSSNEQSCYLLTNIGTNWKNNSIFCEERDANLTSIHSDSENKFVASLCKPNKYCYIGLRKQRKSDNFTWIDGSNSTYKSTWRRPSKTIHYSTAYVVSIEANTSHWLRNKHNRESDNQKDRDAVCKKAAAITTDTLTSTIYENEITTLGAEKQTTVPDIKRYRPTLDDLLKNGTNGTVMAYNNTKTVPYIKRYTLDDLLKSGTNGTVLDMLILAASTDSIDQSLLDWVPPEIENRTNLRYLNITVIPVHGNLSEADVSGLKTSIDVDNCSNCQATVMNLRLDIIDPPTNHTLSGVKGDLKMEGRFISIGVYSNRIKSEKVNISFTVHKEMMNEAIDHRRMSVYCVFINITKMGWSKEDCRTNITSDGGVKCSCTHLTSFGILLQVKPSNDINIQETKALSAITNVCLGISMLSLLLLVPVYCFFRDLWRSTRIFIHTNLVLTLMATYIIFLSGIDSNKNEVCRFVGIALHFTLLSAFMWMMAEAVFIALKVKKTNSTKLNIPRNYLICYGVSAVIVVITIAVDIDNYNTTNPCWLNKETGATYAIVIPALIIITFNMAILVMTLRTIYIKSRSRLPRSEKIQNESILKTVKAALFLLPVFGVTWVFGPLTISKGSKVFEYLFVIFNCLQGLAIFIVYCLLDVEVREQFTKWRARRKRLKDAKSVSSQQRLSLEEKRPPVSHKCSSAVREDGTPKVDGTESLQHKTFSGGDGIIKVEI